MSLLPILRKGYVVSDFGIGQGRYDEVLHAITIGNQSGERKLGSFVSRRALDLELSQEIIDQSIIPIIYELSFKEKQSKIEKAICMAGEWFASSRDHYDINNRYISLVVALECLFSTPENDFRTITSAIAEGVAFLLGDTPEETKRLYTGAKKFYKIRSRMVHGEERSVKIEEVNELSEITERCIRRFIKERHIWHSREDVISYIEQVKFYGKDYLLSGQS